MSSRNAPPHKRLLKTEPHSFPAVSQWEPAHEADRKAGEAAPCEVEEKAVQGAGQEADGEAAEVASRRGGIIV